MLHAFVLNHVFSYVFLFYFVFYFGCLFVCFLPVFGYLFCLLLFCFHFCTSIKMNESINLYSIRRDWRYQREVIRIRKPTKDRQHNGQMKKDKRPNNDLQINQQKTKDWVTRNPLRYHGDLRCSGRVISSCSTSSTRRVAPVSNPVIRHEWGKDREVLTTSRTYQWSFVTHIFRNSKVHLLDYQTILERRPTKLWINDIPNNKTAS